MNVLQQVKDLNKKGRYAQTIALLPDSVLTEHNDAELYFESANARAGDREYDRAIRDYTRAITLVPDIAKYYSGKGTTWMMLSAFEKAIMNFSKVIELEPDDVITYFNRGEAWKATGEYDKAMADYNTGISIQPYGDMCYVGRGHIFFLKEVFELAIEDFNKAIKLKPGNKFAWFNKALVWMQVEQYGKAIEDLTLLIKLDPRHAEAYKCRGEAWFKRKNYDKALQDYNKAITLDPVLLRAYSGRGDVWYDKREYAKAIEDYSRVLEMSPYDIVAYNNRAYSRWALKEYDKAIEDFDVSIGLAPDDAREWFNRGTVKHEKLEEEKGKKTDFEDAIRDFDEALRLKPDLAAAYCNRGVLLSIIEEYNKAIKDFEKAIQLDPGDKIAIRWMGITKSKQEQTPITQNDGDKQAIREQAAAFVEKIRKSLSTKFKQSKEGFLQGWYIEEWDGETNEPLIAGIQGWIPEFMPEIAKWKEITDDEGVEGLATVTHNDEVFFPSLVGIPIKKGLWTGIVGVGTQFRIGEKPLRSVKNFTTVNLLLERTVERIRSGQLDHELVFGEYVLPTHMEEFEAIVKRMLNTKPMPGKKKK